MGHDNISLRVLKRTRTIHTDEMPVTTPRGSSGGSGGQVNGYFCKSKDFLNCKGSITIDCLQHFLKNECK